MNAGPIAKSRLFQPLLLGALFVWMFLFNLRPIQNLDFWWHLASGRYIVQHAMIPHQDVFSLTCRGNPWINTYWFYEVILYTLYRLGGINGLIAAKAAFIVAIFWILNHRLQAQGLHWFWRGLALVGVFLGGHPRGFGWSEHASLVTLFFLSLLFWHLERWQKREWPRPLWAWPFLFMLWANSHRGFVLGLAIAGFYVVEAILDAAKIRAFNPPLEKGGEGGFRRRPNPPLSPFCKGGGPVRGGRGKSSICARAWYILSSPLGGKESLKWWMLCALATLINPYGVGVYQMIWKDLTLSPVHVMGWAPTPWQHLEIYWISIFLLWSVLGTQVAKREPVSAWEFLTSVFLTWVSIRYVVAVPYFVLFSIPYVVTTISRWVGAIAHRSPALGGKGIALGFAFALVFWAIATTQVQGGVNPSIFPVESCDFIAGEKLRGPFYNDYRFGGYWIWRFAGNPKVFIDGRYPAVKGYETLLLEIDRAKSDKPEVWEAFLERHHVRAALMSYASSSLFPSVFEAYFPRSRWALVYWDDVALLFLKRTPKNQNLIDRYEFRGFSPDANPDDFRSWLQAASPAQRQLIQRELLRNATLHPSSRRAQLFLQLSSPTTSQ